MLGAKSGFREMSDCDMTIGQRQCHEHGDRQGERKALAASVSECIGAKLLHSCRTKYVYV